MVEFCCTIPSLKTLTEAPKITAWNSYQLMNLMRGKEGEEMQLIINHMGELSATAQRLRGPITSVDRLLLSFQKLYILTSSVQGSPGHILAQGILKVGQKHLFIRRTANAPLVEISPLCVLDFYVHESCQRQGLGHMLFEFMLEQEKKRACKLGWDSHYPLPLFGNLHPRFTCCKLDLPLTTCEPEMKLYLGLLNSASYDKPSNKLLSFMSKHYNLRSYNSQANQFVVYNDYFEDAENEAQREKENRQKEPNRMPDIGETLRKEKVLHGRRQAGDAEEPSNFGRPDSSRLATAEARPNLNVKESPQQVSFHRGRRNHWQLKQDYSEKTTDPPHTSDTRSSTLQSPTKVGLPLKDAYRRGLNEEGKILQARKASNSQSCEPRKWHANHGAALKPCKNITPLYSVIGEQERLKIQSLCSPSLAQKMNVPHAGRCHQDPKPIKPHPNMGDLATKIVPKTTKEPPPSHPF